jgi:transglutaminase-like putative cysteine protease
VSARAQRRPPSLARLWWTAGVVLGASLCHWPELPIWVPLLLGGCIGWRITAAHSGWRLPGTPLRIVFALLAFAAVLLQYRTINGISAGSALLVVMVALKFLESRNERDQLVLIIISYFLVFAGLLYDRTVFTAAYLLIFVFLTTVGLLQLGRSGPLLPLRATLRLASRLFVPAAPIMVVLFLLFPRLPGPLWGMPGEMTNGSSGLDEELSPGDITELGLSDEVAFRVDFTSRAPAPDRLYWRGPVLSHFDGRRWTRDPGMRRRALDTLEFGGAAVEYRVMLEPHGKRWTFALDMPERWEESHNIFMSSDYQLMVRFAGSIRSRIDYWVVSRTDYVAREPLTEAERVAYTRLPAGSNPRSRTLAASWLAEGAEPREIIRRGLDLFRAEQFFYTLTPPPLGEHTADDFLFSTREGFCEHYASTFAVLMRAAGIPTRIVTGYQGGELNPLGEYFIIRQSDAHAWTEIWLAEEGWVRVDPTAAVAPERIALGFAQSALRDGAGNQGIGELRWLRTTALLWDAFNIYWQAWVLDYGSNTQDRLLDTLGFEDADWKELISLGVLALVALLLGLGVRVAWLYRSEYRRRDPAARCFERFCRKLDREIGPRLPAEGPARYGQRAAAALPARAAAIRGIVDAYLEARYEPDPERKNLDRLGHLVRRYPPVRPRAEADR